MISVALIGGDGSGKSTLAQALCNDPEISMAYLYMGANIESSNYALPWSRLALKVKLRRIRREATANGISDPTLVTTHHMSQRQRSTSLLRTVVRLANRLTEVGYRNIVAGGMKLRGHHVVFDRHFIFDSLGGGPPSPTPTPIDRANRLYHQALVHLFPKPDLILFLDADPSVMVARKPEATVDYLADRNEYWRQLGAAFPNFVTLDANRPPGEVLAAARAAIQGVLADEQPMAAGA